MARKGYGRPSTLVNIITHADDGTSPVGSNEWNENPKKDGIFGLTKSTQAISSNDIDVTDSYIEVSNAGDIYTLSAVTTSLSSTNYASDSTSSISEGDLIYIVKASGVGTVNLKHQNGGAGAGKITTLTAGDKALSVTVPTILMARTISSALEWVEYGGGTPTDLDTTNFAANIIDTDLTSVVGTDTTIPSAKAVKTYVDTQITAEDLDTAGDTGTGTIDLDSQSLAVTGGTGITTTALNQGISIVADDATASAKGVVELATTAELDTGTDTTRAVTVAGIEASARSVKLDAIEASADVTDTVNVNAAAATTVGTITSGTWQGTTVAVNQGGTGTTTSTGTGSTVLSADPALSGTATGVNLTLSGDLTVSGTTTTVNVEDLTVDTADITIMNGNTTASAANDSGIKTQIGASSFKTLLWKHATSAWTSSDNIDSTAYKIAGTTVLSGSTLGSTITGSSLASVGTLTGLTLSGALSGTDVALSGRLKTDKGADVASATAMTLGADGNAFDITGTTTIVTIPSTNWAAGNLIHLQFDGILVVTHSSATDSILLGDQANMTTAAGDVLSLFFNGTNWVEVSRSSVSSGGSVEPLLNAVSYQATNYTTPSYTTRTVNDATTPIQLWVKDIDTNNQGVYMRIKKNGAYTDVQIA